MDNDKNNGRLRMDQHDENYHITREKDEN